MASRDESSVIEKETGKRNLRPKTSPSKKTRGKRKSSSPKSSHTKSDEINDSVAMDEEIQEAPGTADSNLHDQCETPNKVVEENGVECMNEDFGSNGILKVKSNASGKDHCAETSVTDDVNEEKNSPANDENVANIEDMTVIDEVMDESNEKDRDAVIDQIPGDGLEMGTKDEEDFRTEPDTEMVSEDELPNESSKEPLETEAVSDEELPDPATTVDLPETEAVSEDELPPEKTDKKRKAAAAKSKGDSGATAATDGGKKKSRTSEAHKRKLLDGDTYDPSSPTSENSCDESPAAKRAALSSGGSAAQPKTSKTRKSLPELEKYWKAVKEDPSDFTGWTYLLQYVDQENDIDAAREAYDAFLSHYPYCYGYWRKYADYEKRKGNKEKCEELQQFVLYLEIR